MRRVLLAMALVLSISAPAHAEPVPPDNGAAGASQPAVRITRQEVGKKCPQYTYLLIANGLPVAFFDKVMYRESRCFPGAYNGRGRDRSYGLLQINTKGPNWGELVTMCGLESRVQLFIPEYNISCAAKMYSRYGKKPWAV